MQQTDRNVGVKVLVISRIHLIKSLLFFHYRFQLTVNMWPGNQNVSNTESPLRLYSEINFLPLLCEKKLMNHMLLQMHVTCKLPLILALKLFLGPIYSYFQVYSPHLLLMVFWTVNLKINQLKLQHLNPKK